MVEARKCIMYYVLCIMYYVLQAIAIGDRRSGSQKPATGG
jgi:hypothetical protein